MPRYKILIESNPVSNSIEFIENRLAEFNFSQIGNYEYKPLVIFLRDSHIYSQENIWGGFIWFYWFRMA